MSEQNQENQPKKRYRKLGSIKVAQEKNEDGSERLYFQTDDYAGQLLFVDKESQTVYVVKSANVRKPYNKNAPAFIKSELTINLDSPSAVVPMNGSNTSSGN